MDVNTQIIILISVIGLLLLWVAFLTYRQQKMYKRANELFDTSKDGDIYQVLKKYLEETKEVENYAKKLEIEMAKVSKKMQKSIQRIGFIRYNPFGKNDTGGNQSFSIALLDNDNSGFVITSMHAREGTRVYAKSVSDGKSTNTLSDEEVEAIKKATKE
ncbi:MAG: DUF4446 family protein [bacterium]|nr:DUF4446 family protein [bacterium]